jgi:Mg2+-importing ATPase
MSSPTDAVTFWAQQPTELLDTVGSTPQGLTSEAAASRLESLGANVLTDRQRVTALGLILGQFKSPFVVILLFATAVSAITRDWADALIILAIILGSAALSFYQEYSASHSVEALKKQISIKASVWRDGQLQDVLTEDIVPGDVVQLSAGSLIPGDGVVLEARDFFVNQAVLTGETFPVEKTSAAVPPESGLTERTNMVFRGTSARNGTARAVIVQTGRSTAIGQIADRLTLRPPETEFERGIRRLGYLLTQIMLVLVVAVFAVNVYFDKPILDSLLFSIALAVGLTPQLLPAIVTVTLSRGAQSMAKEGVIVQRLSSIENLGSMDTLCTDKTGTLTQGVVRVDGALDVAGEESAEVLRLATLTAQFQTGLSNPLDEAILAGQRFDFSAVAKIDEIPYDFVRKRLSVVVRETPDAEPILVAKGALETLLEVCTSAQTAHGPVALDSPLMGDILQRFRRWSEEGYRVLGAAMRSVAVKAAYTRNDETELMFMGFLLFFDPPKSGVQQVIHRLGQSGVQLKMITGDNKLVAKHTAEAIGIDTSMILTGAMLDELHDEALWHAAERTQIFAEVDPNQKERIILSLQKMGHVVGYLGDGINDAPSLHSADVGISVENAVDVAKQSADLVLLEQDLAVLERGILFGRRTFANTLKYIFMATSANFGNMFSMAIASLFLPFLPMLPKQILLINFLTDFPEMTIADDNVDQYFIAQPRRWDIGFIRRFMFLFGPLSSSFDLLTFAVLLWAMHAGQAVFHTGWFVESVLSASMVVFSLRTRSSVGRSRPSRTMLLTTVVVVAVALMLPYSPLGSALGFVVLPGSFLAVIVGISAAFFAAAEITKRWFYRNQESVPPVAAR